LFHIEQAIYQEGGFAEFSHKHFRGLVIPERLRRVQQILEAAAAELRAATIISKEIGELRAATIISKEIGECVVKGAQFG